MPGRRPTAGLSILDPERYSIWRRWVEHTNRQTKRQAPRTNKTVPGISHTSAIDMPQYQIIKSMTLLGTGGAGIICTVHLPATSSMLRIDNN